MKVSRPVAEGLIAAFGEEGAQEVSPLEVIPAAVERALGELEQIVAAEAVLTLAVDWEGCIFGVMEGDDRFGALYFTSDGRVGHGGVNQPHYVETAAELLSA
ncbi:MAG TPA: hypothetical protein VII45_09100 [Solirubrobacterales bacterium]